MAIWTDEILNPPLIENTTIVKRYMDGIFKVYGIIPNETYVLHDSLLDEMIYDFDTLESTGEIVLRYYPGMRTVAANYDFTANPRKFYAVLRTDVPSDNICDGISSKL